MRTGQFSLNSILCSMSGGFLWPLFRLLQWFIQLVSKCSRLGSRIRALLANPGRQILQVLRYVVYRISTSASHRLHLSNPLQPPFRPIVRPALSGTQSQE